mgnify:CR=1 FL=1
MIVKLLMKWRDGAKRLFDQLVRNRVTEKEILDELGKQGYHATANSLSQLELYALKRPGWVQVYRFQAQVKNAAGQSRLLFGALRSDERYGDPLIRFYGDARERERQLASWSEGLIVRRRP